MANKQPKINTEGISTAEANLKLKQIGLNEIKLSKNKNWIIEFLKEFTEIFSIILIIAAVLAFLAKEQVDAIIILSIIIINSLISFIQKYKADKAIESLQKLVSPTAQVFRDKKLVELKANLLVPSDIIQLSEGMRIPADCIIISSSELYIGESILTGESIPVFKTANKNENELFMGTEVISGTAIAKITKTGLQTKFGQIALLTNNTKKDKSPLQKELDLIGIFVSKITIVIAIVISFLTIFLEKRGLLETLIFSSSVAVAAVPEGLPATVTIALALAVQKLAKKGAIVKQLSSVETLGSTSTIVTDKTGTLTRNEMTVTSGYSPFLSFQVTGIGYNDNGLIQDELNQTIDNPLLKLFKLVSLKCNTAQINLDKETIIGDPTDGALLSFSHKITKTLPKYKTLQTIPFNSVRKMMISLVADQTSSYILVKGAPDIILQHCTKITDSKTVSTLSKQDKLKIEKQLRHMNDQALRTIMLAYLPTPKKQITESDIKDLIFIGLVGIMDPPRNEIQETVNKANLAGIRLIMCTGDHANTALAIGKQLNMVTDENPVITGQEMKKISDKKLCAILSKKENIIFARVNPEDKLRVVELLKKLGEIVAVTGDGVNDAPALKKADIGVAMGITGTEVSKEAANIVLSQDNFNNIIDAIEEGRTTYNNLKKFIYFIFSCNIGELTVILIALLIGLPAPLSAILILTINIGTDVLPALALAMEKAEHNFMMIPPRNMAQKILHSKFNQRFIATGLMIGLIGTIVFITILYKYGYQLKDTITTNSYLYLKASTATFACLVIAQMFNVLNAKSEKQLFFSMKKTINKYLIGSITISILLIVAIIEIPYLNSIFKTTSLTLSEWTLIVALSSTILIYEEIRKFISQKLQPKPNAISTN